MTEALLALTSLLAGFFLAVFLIRRRRYLGQDPEQAPPPPTQPDLYTVAREADGRIKDMVVPEEIVASEPFLRGVEILRSESYSTPQLLSFVKSGHNTLSCMALQVVCEREGENAVPHVQRALAGSSPLFAWFALDTLRRLVPADCVRLVLPYIEHNFAFLPFSTILSDFLMERKTAGVEISFGNGLLNQPRGRLTMLREVVGTFDQDLSVLLVRDLESALEGSLDRTALRTIGSLYGESSWKQRNDIVEHTVLTQSMYQLKENFLSPAPKPVIVIGESGVGKSVLAELLSKELAAEGWDIFRAGAQEILAGQSFVGQLESQVKELIANLARKRILFLIPAFHELAWAGQHLHSRISVLDMLVRSFETGEVKLLGETTQAAFDRLLISKPQFKNMFLVLQLGSPSKHETIQLAGTWVKQIHPDYSCDAAVLREAYDLAEHYLPFTAPPGNLIELIRRTVQYLKDDTAERTRAITIDDLMETVGRMSGMPREILDDRVRLDVRDIRAYFSKQILGQPEVIETIVDRLAMIKAGLTDPKRPQGVFLFVGPTGTGKTEVCKKLAEYLFGSPERLIRLDMGEFLTPESVLRIVGDVEGRENSRALVDLIRQNPFSVVLLDEFEKAHPNVWDLFLSICDDGRLTGASGSIGDFRHAIIIMTSNLGSGSRTRPGIGFAQEEAAFSPASVQRTVEETFRREFFNRIDKVVVFRPLTREVMREILNKELNEILQRRGLRNKAWAIEWDESAIEFLLARGFTPDLGARPLKRAIDQYLLSPLAHPMINQELPQGEQFLFVQSDGKRIDVKFIDPDERPDEVIQVPAEPLNPGRLVLGPQGSPQEVRHLSEKLTQLAARLDDPAWTQRRDETMERIASVDFWDSPDRFSFLSAAEYYDRIRSGVEAASSIARRLNAGTHPSREFYPVQLVQRLAQLIFLVEKACEGVENGLPPYAFIRVRSGNPGRRAFSEAIPFAMRVAEMYRLWAAKRNMEYQVLQQIYHEGEHLDHVATVAGLAAYPLLKDEEGLHVLEFSKKGRSPQRAVVHVEVAPQPDAAPRKETLALATDTLAGRAMRSEKIVRKYREDPSPLVRDAIRGWRTGNPALVLGGDFDVIGYSPTGTAHREASK